jgi:ribosome-binding factor A
MRRPDPKKKKRAARGPSQRQLRAGELVRRALADIIGRGAIHDPDLMGRAITISEVRVSNDMRHATCFVAPLGGSLTGEDGAKLVEALTRVKSFLRGQLAKEVTFKYMPDLTFSADLSFDQAEAVDRLLHSPKVAQDLIGEEDDDNNADDEA